MAGFFDTFFKNIKNLFKSKDLDSNIENFQSRIDIIINDLLAPYTTEGTGEESQKLGLQDTLSLLDPKKCNKIAITLSSNLDKNYTKLQLEQFASSILIGKENTNDESKLIENKDKKVSKKEICNAVAIHYVKILNLISAILTAVNPNDNICLNRMKNLLTVINEDEQTGVSAICDSRAPP